MTPMWRVNTLTLHNSFLNMKRQTILILVGVFLIGLLVSLADLSVSSSVAHIKGKDGTRTNYVTYIVTNITDIFGDFVLKNRLLVSEDQLAKSIYLIDLQDEHGITKTYTIVDIRMIQQMKPIVTIDILPPKPDRNN